MIVGITRTNSAENNYETSPGDTEGDPTSVVIRLGWADVTRDLGIVQTLATFASESDITITEDIVNELIHRRLFEPTSSIGPTAEASRTLDLLGQEVADICTQSIIRRELGVQRRNLPTLPSSPQINRPGTQLHLIFSHAYRVVL